MQIIITIIAAIVALIAGLLVGLRLGSRGEAGLRDRLVGAEASLAREQGRVLELSGTTQALQARLEEREQAAERASEQFEAQMRQTIDVVLSRSGEEFVKLADRTAASLSKQTEGAMATGEQRIKVMVEPLTELVKRYDLAVQELDRRRQDDRSTLDERLRKMVEVEQGLQAETNKLVRALRRPEVRGRWGEMTLRNAVERIGMSQHCDFDVQRHIVTDTGALRPDMIINLPGGGTIVVDNKVPMDAYLQALDAPDTATREQCLRTHAAQCRKHISDLAKKAYWDQLDTSPSCVVMFIPMESLYMAALEADPELMTSGIDSNVMVATPATFVGLLHTLAHGWDQQTLADNLVEVRSLAGEFYSRLLTFAGYFSGVGKSLTDAVNRYNSAVNSANSRLYTQATRLRELGVPAKEDLPELKSVETAPVPLRAELQALPEGDEE